MAFLLPKKLLPSTTPKYTSTPSITHYSKVANCSYTIKQDLPYKKTSKRYYKQ